MNGGVVDVFWSTAVEIDKFVRILYRSFSVFEDCHRGVLLGVMSVIRNRFWPIVLLVIFGFTTSRLHGGTVRYWDERCSCGVG